MNPANTIDYVHRFISSLVFTTTIETIVLLLLLVYVFKKREQLKDIVFAGVLGSFATIPYVWFVFPFITYWPRATSLMWSEPFAVLVEALIYNRVLKLNWKYALAASIVCNIASYFIGPLLRAYGLWIYW